MSEQQLTWNQQPFCHILHVLRSKGESFITSYVYPLEEAFTSGCIIKLVLSRQAKIEYGGRLTWMLFDNAENG